MTDQTHSPFDASLSAAFLDISVKFEVGCRFSIRGSAMGFANGTEVAIQVVDTQSNYKTLTATVTDGVFEVRHLDERVFAPGILTITASAGDQMAQQSLVLQARPDLDPIVIDQQPVLNALNQLSIQGKAPTLTSRDELQLVIRDVDGNSVFASAVVQSDGRFSVHGISTNGLMDGTLFIDVKAQTHAGAISVVNASNLEQLSTAPEVPVQNLAPAEDSSLALTMAVADAAFAHHGVPELDLAGFVAKVRSDKAKEASLLDAQGSVKVFLYDTLQDEQTAVHELFATADSGVTADQGSVMPGLGMDLLAEHIMRQSQG
ncbi:hypothetical protein [Limnohabitans sp. Bal53]|uniref:hypothetical protein n=1 Tax=Limnohabitans sp. Bal53 TaxID=1977910 RepID=UPI000D3A85C2|nr:hypothetical protein [Limnohabitans sp. Bal53]PUE41790.1 hypothetical protein B9Z50_09010 [Limnohabitans sp. Bal53]